MSYRLKNSDFKPFLGILGRKMSDLWVHIGEGIGCILRYFCQGKCARGKEEKCQEIIY
jgi:hypothetical protein